MSSNRRGYGRKHVPLPEDCAKPGENQLCNNKKNSKIYKTFKRRTCSQFIPSKEDVTECCCGRLEENHPSETKTQILEAGVTWDANIHTVAEPTNAFGELEFTGAGQTSRAKFIRISHDSDPEEVLKLLTENWRLELPKLLISVTGGAKSFTMHPKLKHVLRQGLLKAAETTGAWILTGGTNTGVMRYVGEAVKGYTVKSRGAVRDKTSQLYLIGIATWGIVNHRNDLVDSEGVVTYHMTSSLSSGGACLDNNHSHFILVDDGTEGKYGGEIAFRARLQNCITTKKLSSNKSHGIPVVLLVLEGGPNTIRTALESVTRNPAVPVVIAEGSGRAADILAHAHSLVTTNDGSHMEDFYDVVVHQQLLMKIEKAFPECSEEKCVTIYHDVLSCVRNTRYITIFRMDEDGSDIDRAILKALLKAEHASAADQLSLALIWNRADIARTEIFTENQKWEMAALEEAMMDALRNNRVKFVNLLLENGVCMSKFLTTPRLLELYKARWSSSVTLRQILGKDEIESSFNLLDVTISRLLGSPYKRQKCDFGIERAIYIANRTMSVDGHHNNMRSTTNEFKPYDELLLWAVLCNMQEMALFMWERGDENLARALVAAKLYNAMARLTESDDAISDVTEDLYAHVDEFKRLALGFLDQCFRTNEDLTQQLLTYNVKNWGEQTCLSLAVSIEHEEFLAHVSCQILLTDIWMGAMKSASSSTIKTIMGILFPPAIFSLEFKTKQELRSMPVTSKEYDQDLAGEQYEETENEEQENRAIRDSRCLAEGNSAIELRTYSLSNGKVLSTSRELNRVPSYTRGALKTPTWVKKILGFYQAPVTKFWSNVFAYLAFLTLFSYLILIRQDEIPSISEIVVIVFVCSLGTEEIRQILHSEPTTLSNKLKDWASSKWNILDGFAVILFFVGLGLRLCPTTRTAGHVVYCLDVMLWITRLLHIFSVSKHLGPYVVMIGRMTKDMLKFLIIMMVFLLAYGVAQQAILHPDEPASWSVLSGVFYKPYFQVYGELFMEAPDTIDKSTTLFETPRKDAHGDTIVAFIVAFYLLVANILLLNLLIAIFNNTYNSVEANSNQIWKFKRYYLVMEYYQRPVLIPPFIVFNHVINLFKGLYHWRKNCLPQNNEDPTGSTHRYGLKRSLKDSELQKLTLFEERCVDGYLREKDTLLHATQEEKIKIIGDRMESVSCQLQDMCKESVTQFNTNKTWISSLDTRITKLEEHTHRIVGLLEKLCATGEESKGGHMKSARSASVSDVVLNAGSLGFRTSKTAISGRRLKSLSEAEQTSNPKELAAAWAKSSVAKQSRDNKTAHALARQSPYPHSTQRRRHVPDFLVDWKESFPGYDPPLFTAPEVEAFPHWADPDILDPRNSNFVINFNRVESGIDRRSQTGMIDTVNRLPRNPMGRTGLAGRGLLGRWGPNHTVHFILTRWKCRKDGQIIQRQGKNVLEFVAIKSRNNLELTFPGGLIEVGNSLSETLNLYFKKQIVPAVKLAFYEEKALTEEIILNMIQSSEEIYKGYLDDQRNTDNAWVETVAMNFHDETGKMLTSLDFKDEKGAPVVLWQELSGQIKLEAANWFLLYKVAQIWNAFY
ncbi:transient receptor potential cation channel subfamily M member-like 2 isoform X1 [Acropora palmata]|uniref:transient receptor potential cation channel subfamily M member-like 2 isoform X1 n=1 Tax=Acropora palmata TaxID=6131 RepID=UPI003DA0A540